MVKNDILSYQYQCVDIVFLCSAIEATAIGKAFLDAETLCDCVEVTNSEWVNNVAVSIVLNDDIHEDYTHKVVIETICGVAMELITSLCSYGVEKYSSNLHTATLLELHAGLIKREAFGLHDNGYGVGLSFADRVYNA